MATHNDKPHSTLPGSKTGTIDYTSIKLPIQEHPDPNPRGPDYQRTTVPQLNLKGMWLREFGFEIGSAIRIEPGPGRLVISLDEVASEEADRAMP